MEDIRPKPETPKAPATPRVMPEQPKTADTRDKTPHVGDQKDPVRFNTRAKP